MKSVIFTLLLSFYSTVLVAQGTWPAFITAESSLNIRNQPNANGDVIASIPFGTKIDYFIGSEQADTINGVSNSWVMIKYKDLKGYAWGEYVSSNKNLILNYGLLHVNGDGSKHNPKLNWYGVFESDQEGMNEVKKVQISLEEQTDEYYGTMSDRVKINDDRRPLFLFGSKKSLSKKLIHGISHKPKIVNGKISQTELDRYKDIQFLYPEEVMQLSIPESRKKLNIKAKDQPYIDSTNNIIYTRYELEVTNENFDDFRRAKTQNITSEIPFINAPASRCAIYKNPKIMWYGDLDNDEKVDIIIATTTMADTDGIDTSWILFLSSEAEPSKFLKAVAKTLDY